MQMPNKEDSAESFALPCSIGEHVLTALADLGSSINVMPLHLFQSLNFTHLEKTNLVIEMANMTRATPVGIVNNAIVKIDRFLFPADFVIVDMANTPNEDLILGRPFLATARARIDVFMKEISLGAYDERITFRISQTPPSKGEEVANSCVANTTYRNPHSVTLGASNEVFDSINPICLLQCGDQEAVSSIEKSAEKGTTDKDPPLEPWIDKKTTTFMKHFCEPLTVSSNEKICAPTCFSFNKSCNRGGRQRLRQLKREARIWSCYVDQNQWELNYRKSINSNEDIGWTSHFCTPALKKDAGITQAWPTCDPSKRSMMGEVKYMAIKRRDMSGLVSTTLREARLDTLEFHLIIG